MVTNTTELIETGEKRDRLGRRITPAARRAELVAAWREGGLTQAEFARREGINYSSFAAWVQAARLRPAVSSVRPAQAPVRFVAASLPSPVAVASAFALCVRLPDGTELRGSKASDVAALVRAIRA
jgi:transposase-like protein